MPHDKNKQPIKEGDRVNVEFTVKRVYETEGGGYCNAELETVEPMYPTENKSQLTINARQCVLSSSGEETAATAPTDGDKG